MIYREKLLFIEEIYDLARNTSIYRKNLRFSEKRYYLPRKSMI